MKTLLRGIALGCVVTVVLSIGDLQPESILAGCVAAAGVFLMKEFENLCYIAEMDED